MAKKIKEKELWNLDITMAKYIAPRLKAFRKKNFSHPASMSAVEWNKCLKKMIKAFELISGDDFETPKQAIKNQKKIKKGLKLFAKYYQFLWM